MDFSNHKFRCSSLGALMTEPREKSSMDKWLEAKENLAKAHISYDSLDNKATKTAMKAADRVAKLQTEVAELAKTKDEIHLSETCKAELIKIFIHEHYGREKEIESKYIKKGLAVEEDSITLVSRIKKKVFFKNDQRLENEFLTGEPDLFEGNSIRQADHILDTKSCWDIFTFFQVKTKPVNREYKFQLNGYGALSGAKKLTLAYCLIDTPEPLINDEARRMMWKMAVATDQDPLYLEAYDKLRKNMTYEDIPLKDKLIEFTFEREEAIVESIYKMVPVWRNWLNEFAKQYEVELAAA